MDGDDVKRLDRLLGDGPTARDAAAGRRTELTDATRRQNLGGQPPNDDERSHESDQQPAQIQRFQGDQAARKGEERMVSGVGSKGGMS